MRDNVLSLNVSLIFHDCIALASVPVCVFDSPPYTQENKYTQHALSQPCIFMYTCTYTYCTCPTGCWQSQKSVGLAFLPSSSIYRHYVILSHDNVHCLYPMTSLAVEASGWRNLVGALFTQTAFTSFVYTLWSFADIWSYADIMLWSVCLAVPPSHYECPHFWYSLQEYYRAIVFM